MFRNCGGTFPYNLTAIAGELDTMLEVKLVIEKPEDEESESCNDDTSKRLRVPPTQIICACLDTFLEGKRRLS